MGLLQPESGLLFWMCLSFGIVFLVLARYGFPVILRAIESRREYIDRSLAEAREAERRLSALQDESRAILAATEKERSAILHDAGEAREQLLAEARRKAEAERERIIAEGRRQGEAERQELLRDARRQVALLAVAVTERMLRSELADTASQTRLAERLIDEMNREKTSDPCISD